MSKFKMVDGRLLLFSMFLIVIVQIIVIFISNIWIQDYKFKPVMPVIIMGFIWPIFSSMGEEFGWRGYVLPYLLNKFSPIKASIALGIIWSCWHLPMYYLAMYQYGFLYFLGHYITQMINLIVISCIMVLLYKKGNGSLIPILILHYTITASAILIEGLFRVEGNKNNILMESLLTSSFLLMVVIYNYKELKGTTHLV